MTAWEHHETLGVALAERTWRRIPGHVLDERDGVLRHRVVAEQQAKRRPFTRVEVQREFATIFEHGSRCSGPPFHARVAQPELGATRRQRVEGELPGRGDRGAAGEPRSRCVHDVPGERPLVLVQRSPRDAGTRPEDERALLGIHEAGRPLRAGQGGRGVQAEETRRAAADEHAIDPALPTGPPRREGPLGERGQRREPGPFDGCAGRVDDVSLHTTAAVEAHDQRDIVPRDDTLHGHAVMRRRDEHEHLLFGEAREPRAPLLLLDEPAAVALEKEGEVVSAATLLFERDERAARGPAQGRELFVHDRGGEGRHAVARLREPAAVNDAQERRHTGFERDTQSGRHAALDAQLAPEVAGGRDDEIAVSQRLTGQHGVPLLVRMRPRFEHQGAVFPERPERECRVSDGTRGLARADDVNAGRFGNARTRGDEYQGSQPETDDVDPPHDHPPLSCYGPVRLASVSQSAHSQTGSSSAEVPGMLPGWEAFMVLLPPLVVRIVPTLPPPGPELEMIQMKQFPAV